MRVVGNSKYGIIVYTLTMILGPRVMAVRVLWIWFSAFIRPVSLGIDNWNCLSWNLWKISPFSANPTKWSNTLTQFVGKLPTNGLSVFDHFMGLALKGLKTNNALNFCKNCISWKFWSVSLVICRNALVQFNCRILWLLRCKRNQSLS